MATNTIKQKGLMKNKILVTGSAGFIGFHLTKQLAELGFDVLGLDVINSYYSTRLKRDRLSELGFESGRVRRKKITTSSLYPNLRFIQADLADFEFVNELMLDNGFDCVIHLAAQAGVRYSIDNPRAYTHSNIDGFLSVLEGAKRTSVSHFIYASTSSVYGLNSDMPLNERQPTAHPMAFYAATKKANEMMAHSYSHLFDLPTTGLRFFTVYGPWGRPDMAISLFADAMIKGEPINLFNNGKMIRDFTFIDDIVSSITRLIDRPPRANTDWDSRKPRIDESSAPYQLFNVGNGKPVELMEYVKALEVSLGVEAQYNMMPIQPGDVLATHADTSSLANYVNFKPNTPVGTGVKKFAEWFKSYYLK